MSFAFSFIINWSYFMYYREQPHPEYLVYTYSCKISDMNAFDNSVSKYIKKGYLQKCDKPFVLSSNKVSIVYYLCGKTNSRKMSYKYY